jgi:hypothetical protein
MSEKNLSRRNFINKTMLGITGTAISAIAGTEVSNASPNAMSAASYKKIMGANDRINIAFLGCGSRSQGHQQMVKMSVSDKNLGVVAVCDLWKGNREKTAANCKKLFGNDVKQLQYSEDLLQMPELDAVMIATGDFQHAKLLAEVVKAGKDAIVKSQWQTMLQKRRWREKLCLLQNKLCRWDRNG